MSAIAGRVLLIPKGTYDASTTYHNMDIVKYGVSSYVCKMESTGNLPTNTTYWQILAEGIENVSPEAIGIGYGVSSDSGSARTATLADYNLTPNGIVAVTFGADVPANATLNINSQGAKPIYFRGSAIVANVIKGGDTVTFAYDGTHYDILCIDGGAGHKILNSAGTELTQRDALQASDGLEFVDDSTNQRTKVKMNLPIVPRATWDAMTTQEKNAYIASHYRFGVEQPDTSGVINAEYMTLLWENPNTTQAFASQTITLNSADYDMLLWLFAYNNSNANEICATSICSKGNSIYAGYTGVSNVRFRECNYTNDTTYAITDAKNNSTTDNTIVIPLAVYGIKKNFQFKVNAIATELSTRADHCFLDDETTTVEDALTWKRYVADSTASSITLSGVTFREVMVDVSNVSGNTSPRYSLIFSVGYSTRKRSGSYTSSANNALADVTYDGNNTFNIAFYSSGTAITTYTNIYYR